MASADCLMCEKLFEYLADAKDISMLESRHAAVMQSKRLFNSVPQNGNGLLGFDNPRFIRLCTRAAVNSINVALQDSRNSLLLHSKLVEVVCALCHILTDHIKHAYQQNTKEFLQRVRNQATDEITAAGLMSALVKFTVAAWQAVQQLDTKDSQQQQQQRVNHNHKHKHGVQHHLQQQQAYHMAQCLAAALILEELLAVWAKLHSCSAVPPAHQEVLPVLISVVTTAPTLLLQAARSIGCSSSNNSMNSTALPQFEKHVRRIAAMSSQVAYDFVIYYSLFLLQSDRPELPQQIVQADKLPELLLQLVAHQAAKLHEVCSGMSQVVQANRTAAARGHTTDEQQQQQQDPPSAGCVVPPHHLTLLRLTGIGCSAGFVSMVDIQPVFAVTLAALHEVVLSRHTAAQLSSNSSDSSQQDTRQQDPQQQQPGANHSVLPSHLLVPAVKVLIDVLLLLPPASNPHAHATTLKLIRLLLTTTITPPPTPPTAAAAAGPWLQLPAAVAAGLLQPVISQLSQAVICCLLQTEHHQKKQQQSAKQQMDAETDRLAVLHEYGCVLLAVCHAVESKHIAAVLHLQSAPDLLISLAAIEAVIRAQACHLAPAPLKQQVQQPQQKQKQQEQPPDVDSVNGLSSNSRSLGGERDIRQHPLAHAPLLLLPFVSKAVESLESISAYLLQQQGLTTPPTVGPGSVSRKLSARLCTLLATALKIGKCAVAAAAPDQQERLSGQAMTNAAIINKFASCWCSAVQDSTSRVTGAGNVVQDQIMSVGLMFRALHAGSVAMASWAERYDLQLEAAAAAAEQATLSAASIDQPCASEITGVTHFEMLEGLDEALAKAGSVLDNLAAAAQTAPPTTSLQPTLSQQQDTSSSSVLCREQLQLLSQQSQQIRACVLPCQLLFKFTLPRLPDGVVCATYTAEEICAIVAPRSIDEVCGLLQNCIDGGHPSEGMPASPSHLSRDTCDVAAAVVPWFPLAVCCNNPDCRNLTKLSEWQLVCGKACVCAGCEVARYCSSACQQQHWKLHKHVCSGLGTQK